MSAQGRRITCRQPSRDERAERRGGRADLVEPFTKEATSGNYTHLLATVMDYVEVD